MILHFKKLSRSSQASWWRHWLHHSLAGPLRAWITTTLSPQVLRWTPGLSFIGMGIWTMIPDEIEEEETNSLWGPLLVVISTTLITDVPPVLAGDKIAVRIVRAVGSPRRITECVE